MSLWGAAPLLGAGESVVAATTPPTVDDVRGCPPAFLSAPSDRLSLGGMLSRAAAVAAAAAATTLMVITWVPDVRPPTITGGE